ncbi:UvrB/UvrC motif-containing protein [Lacrimispora celerecrescens]|uniref:Protein arginine kinase activator n=1 Tax=[Clostridium] celerecrescens 18A TaxID=1286362 RepID=A0A2M8Z6B7_9FIRM|nr:UvrB/UvrC motif-containing protein [Lacrimispora celerecrescens]PJJ28979.1 protein arginine kinase activator [[Clostridium] celerecrescens 18A]
MLCEKCKIREANIQYTEVVNGTKKEHHFCAQCAKEMDFGVYAAIFDGEFPLGKLLSGLLGIEDKDQEPDKLHQILCPNCGTGYDEFVRDSRFGCADCYSVFGPLMEDSLKQLHGNLVHTGKTPVYQRQVSMDPAGRGNDRTAGVPLDPESAANYEEIFQWDAKLKEALRFEDYETAAVCRDKIRELKKGNETDA